MTAEDFDVVLTESKTIRKANGDLVLAYFKSASPEDEYQAARARFAREIEMSDKHQGSLDVKGKHFGQYEDAMQLVRRAAVYLAGEQGVRDSAPEDVFQFLTVQVNLPTKRHRDGKHRTLCAMSVIDDGKYDGCYLVYPDYRVAVDLRGGDILLCDLHEWHGNTSFENCEFRKFTRMNVVMYNFQ